MAERSATTLCSTTLCAARPNIAGPEALLVRARVRVRDRDRVRDRVGARVRVKVRALLLSRVKEPRHDDGDEGN